MATGNIDFKLTKEEADSLREALKKDEFRKLLAEYAEEISNPENKRRYEEDIKALESERGVDVQFVNIKPKLVLKTTALPSRKKLFINVGESDLVEVPTATTSRLPNGKTGSQWSIPYTITRPRDDMSNGKKCMIVDIGFHSEAWNQVEKDHRFLELIISTALEGVERDLGLTIDRKHVKKMKFEYKGTPQPSVIRKKMADTGQGDAGPSGANNSGPFKIPYPPLKDGTHEKSARHQQKEKLKKQTKNEPKYSVVHRGEFEWQDHTYSPIGNGVKRPKELVVTVNLPKLDSTKTVELDIFEKKLILVNDKPNYHLELNLSYPVNEEFAKAKFDKSSRTLVITLPVLPPVTPPMPHPHLTNSAPTVLVEELKEVESPNGDESSSRDSKDNRDAEIQSQPVIPSVRPDWSVNESWKCPPFSYRQNEDCISFVLHVAIVKANTVTSHFDQYSVHITFKGSEQNNGTAFSSYSFYVEFDRVNEQGPVIKMDECKINIGSENIVLVVAKGPEELQKFRVGSNPLHLTEKLFMTDANVAEVCRLTDQIDPWKSNGTFHDDLTAEVVRKNDDECVISVTGGEQKTPPTGPLVVESVSSDNEITKKMAPPTISVAMDTSAGVKEDVATPLRSNGEHKSGNKEGKEIPVTKSLSDGPHMPLPNGCGLNKTGTHETKKLITFSNELLYDLD